MRVIGFTGGGHCGPEHGDKLRAAGASVVIDRMADLPKTVRAFTHSLS
jgi:phosphoglycolate phosphatase-like HAD superfamily hydrolase